jgi:hypothetical protein
VERREYPTKHIPSSGNFNAAGPDARPVIAREVFMKKVMSAAGTFGLLAVRFGR